MEAQKIRRKRLKPYIQEVTKIHKEKIEQKRKEEASKIASLEFTKEETMKLLKKTRNELVKQHDNLCNQYNDLRNKLKVKSTAETRTKRIEEKVSIRIELKKLENRIKLLSRVIEAYDTNISLAKYKITPSSELTISKIEANNQELLTLLNKEYEKLDVLSTKMVLVKEFKTERLKGLNKYDFGPFPLAGGLVGAVAIGIPFPEILNLPFTLTNLSLSIGIPFVVGFSATTYVMVKTIKQRIEVFNNLNNQLGDEYLSIENNDAFEEYTEIEKLIDNKVHEIMIILMNQKENEMILEYLQKEKTKDKQNNSNPKTHIPSKNMQTTEYDTIICNSGRWVGFEDIPSNYPSKMAVECSCRTEEDDTIEMGVLYRNLECDDKPSEEERGHVLSRHI